MPSGMRVTPPKDDAEYFERLSKTLFTSGLSWATIDKKWPGFREAFEDFAPGKVAKMTGRDISSLMKDDRIVRNERKIAATVNNAKEVLRIEKEFGSFKDYLGSFKENERSLQADIQSRFKHVGPSTARMFLWSVGYKLTPTAEEKSWMAKNRE